MVSLTNQSVKAPQWFRYRAAERFALQTESLAAYRRALAPITGITGLELCPLPVVDPLRSTGDVCLQADVVAVSPFGGRAAAPAAQDVTGTVSTTGTTRTNGITGMKSTDTYDPGTTFRRAPV